MQFMIRRSRNGYDVSLFERTGFRRVYEATKRTYVTMDAAKEACRAYGRGLEENGHDVLDATLASHREDKQVGEYVSEGLGESSDFCPSDNN